VALAQAPSVGGVLNGASYTTTLVAGSAASIGGTNLASSTGTFGGVQPVPTTLNGTSAKVGGYSAPIYFTSQGQVNIQIPWELAGQTSASLTVTTGAGTSSPVTINLSPYAPALFSQNASGTGAGLIYNANGNLNSSTNAANPGSIVVIGATNLGPAQIQQSDGQAPNGNLVPIANSVSVTIGGTPANVVLAELCGGAQYCPEPNSTYLIYVQVPNVSGTALSVVVMEGTATSNTVTMNVASQALTIDSGPGFGDFQLGPVQIPLQASGGAGGPYTWSLASGSNPLPAGLLVRNDGVPSYFPTGITSGIIGVANTAGSATFTIQVTDGANNIATRTCNMTILSLAITDPPQLSDGFVGTAYSYSLTAAGAAGSVTWAVPNSSLPSGLSISSSTGTISGTPHANGNYGFNVSATDSTGTTTRFYNLNVYGVGFSGSADLDTPGSVFTPGSTVNISLSGAGGTPPYTFGGCCLPPGLSLSQSGAITGTITGGDGTFRFNVGISDSAGHFFSQNFVMNVIGTPTLPGINVANPIEDSTTGESRNFPLNVNGGVSPYHWSISSGSLPAGMRLLTSNIPSSYNLGPDDAVITGVPTAAINYEVAYPFTVSVTDSSPTPFTVSIPVTINVEAIGINYPPNPLRGVAYDGYVQQIGAPQYPTPDQDWTIQDGTLPTGLSLNATTGHITGTPTEDSSSNVFMQIQAATLQLHRYIGFNIQSPTSPPITLNNLPSLPDGLVNNNYNYNVSACCAPNGLNFSPVGSLPAGLTLNPNGQLFGTPSVAGQYNVEIKAIDNNNSNNFGIGFYTLNVSPLALKTPVPPAFVGTFYTTAFSVTSGSSGTLTWTLQEGSQIPPGLTLSATGTFSGTPTSPGNFNLNFIVSDTSGNSFHGGFGINVYPASSVPPPSMNFGNNFGSWPLGAIQYALNASGGNGTYTWSLVNGSLPTGLAIRTDGPFAGAGGALAGLIGVATTPGNYAFTLSVTSDGQTSYQYCTWRITALNVMDSGSLPPAFIGVPYTYTFTALNAAGTVTFTQNNGTMAPGLSLSSNGVISGTPRQAGNFNFGYLINDGTDVIGRGTNINVSAVYFTSSAILNNVQQNGVVNATFTAAGGTGGYSYSAGGLPCCLSLSPGGILTGNLNGVGNFGFSVTVTDSTRETYTQQFSIDAIGDPQQLPSINLGPLVYNPISFLGGYMSWIVSVTNGGTAPFTWEVAGLPPGVSYRPYTASELTYMTPGDIEIWGVPTSFGTGLPPNVGTFDVTYRVTDANGLSATLVQPLTISAIAADGSTFPPNGTLGTAYSDKLRVLGGTAPYSVSQIVPSFNPLPDGLTLNRSAFTLSGTPLETGSFYPDFLFTDSAGNSIVMLTGFNIASGTSPQININNYFNLGDIIVGNSYNNQLNACCTNSGQYTYSVDPTTLPPGIGLSSSGAFSGTGTTAGTYTFLVKAADSTNLSNAGYKQFVVTVTPIQLTASTNLPDGNELSPYSYQIPTSGGSGAVSFQLGPQGPLPPGIMLSSGGLLSGTPTATGQFLFNATISDNAGNTFLGYFSLSIHAPNTGPNACSVSNAISTTVADVQAIVNQALGKAPAANDVNRDGVVNVIDVQIVINAVLGLGCTQ
jgi:uncharacterized protein (TIGR03437 family)